jgi:hypothetical protein
MYKRFSVLVTQAQNRSHALDPWVELSVVFIGELPNVGKPIGIDESIAALWVMNEQCMQDFNLFLMI